jgi:hypothetical protein
MPRFFFDLFFDRYVVLDSRGIVFEAAAGAKAAADQIAERLLTLRFDLRQCGGWIRVRDDRRQEIGRSSIAAEGSRLP